jgi:hypothetical protein
MVFFVAFFQRLAISIPLDFYFMKIAENGGRIQGEKQGKIPVLPP